VCVWYVTGCQPGSVADMIAPNIRQSVKCSQSGYSKRVKPNMRPLKQITCNHTAIDNVDLGFSVIEKTGQRTAYK